MENNLVSIIMPNYNCEKYISESIESVISQSYECWELIIVDDKSTDNSVEIIKRYMSKDKRIHLIINDENKGAAYSRNLALKKASGFWVAFLDSDDLWKKEKLEKQIKFMTDNNYDFSYSYYERIDEIGNPMNIMITGPKKIGLYKMYRYNYLGCLTVMYKMEKVGIVSVNDKLKSRNDYAMWLQIAYKCKCHLLKENLASYRIRKGTLSHSGLKKTLKNQYLLFRCGLNKGIILSSFLTIRNMFWGFLKKIIYKKKI